MPNRFSISVATVVMLVVLRINVGWHFFSEGAKHCADAHWTSEPVLRDAKGPLAPWFHAYLPDFHGFDEVLHGEPAGADSHAVQSWVDAIGNDWETDRQEFAAHYALNDKQTPKSKDVLRQYQDKLRGWGAAHAEALATHVHEWARKEKVQEAPGADVPFQKQRAAIKQLTLAAEAKGWLAELRKLEAEYDGALTSILNEEQRSRPPLAHRATPIAAVDAVMSYAILAIGLLLLVGLFTRLACVAGALFLFSVVMMQPFWVSDTHPTYNQWVEMFALLALATTQVGRWGGLDFFVHHFFFGSSRAKGPSDVFEP